VGNSERNQQQGRPRPRTPVDDAEDYLRLFAGVVSNVQPPLALVKRLVDHAHNLEREAQKLGNRIADLESGGAT